MKALLRRGLGDEAREHCRRLLPIELGVVVLVEQEEPDHARCHVRQAADLACVHGAVDVQHLRSRHAHRLGDRNTPIGAVARMRAAEVVGDPTADRVELDPAADPPAAFKLLGLLEGEHLRLEKLQLQRHGQPIFRAAGTHAHEAFAGHEHLPGCHGLQAVEVREPVGIRLVGPREPQPLDPIAERSVLDQR